MATEITADIEDTNFMEGMKTLLGFDDEQVEKLLDELDSESLVALADAVAKQDKTAIESIIGSFENRVSSLFGGKAREKSSEKSSEKDKKKPVKPPKDYEFIIGDDVAIKTTDDDGKESFVSATVYKPQAPGNTIGVKIDGKAKMVDKSDVYTLKEMVIGMTNMPDLTRMQQLAGIQPPQAASPVSIEKATPSCDQPMMYDREEEEDMNDVAKALSALDTLENVLPNVRLGDVKTLRARIQGILTSMNETLSPGRAKKKL